MPARLSTGARHDDRRGPARISSPAPVYVRGRRSPATSSRWISLNVKVRQDWGFVSIMPLLGTLPEDFTEYETIHPKVDQRAQCLRDALGRKFRSIRSSASSPPRRRRPGAVAGRPCRAASAATWTTRSFVPGTTLYLPVYNEGALFFAAMATACKATAKSASPRSKPA